MSTASNLASVTHLQNQLDSESLTHCFHCMETLPKYSNLFAEIDGLDEPVCCHGCKAAAEFIGSKGLSQFYQHRKHNADNGQITNTDIPKQDIWQFLDTTKLNGRFVTHSNQGDKEIRILVDGLYCSSCSWLINKAVHDLDPDIQTRVELDAKRIQFTIPVSSKTKVSELLLLINRLGYQPTPLAIDTNHEQLSEFKSRENRQFIKRIVVAGFGMMQVMTYAVALYLADAPSMDANIQRFLTLISMLVATCVVFYSGKPFFINALNDLKNYHFGMDVPIALAIGGAYLLSVYDTLIRAGQHIYFDSAVMFVFFLLIGRYLEMRARHRLTSSSEALMKLLPSNIQVERIKDNQAEKCHIRIQDVVVGDRLTLQAGDIIPFDAKILDGQALLDESLITGEATAIKKSPGNALIAGSKVVSGNLSVKAYRQWSDSSIVKIEQTLQKPSVAAIEENSKLQQFSQLFVVVILLLTAMTSLFWWFYQPERIFEVVLALLIASCPCAFALAAPVSNTAAIHALQRAGILLSNAKALTLISQISLWCFDKTGTLTKGKTEINKVITHADLDPQQCLNIIASMETHSQHAFANAFSNIETTLLATQVKEFIGCGLSASIDGVRYWFGKRDWVANQSNSVFKDPIQNNQSEVVLGTDSQLLATVVLNDELRPGTRSYLNDLKTSNKQTLILSGDQQPVVDSLAQNLSVDQAIGNLLPDDKLTHLKAHQALGSKVAMIGDGVNDAPVLSQADLSIVLSSGSELSQSQADVILLNGRLNKLSLLQKIAKFTQQVTKQNLSWALVYNALVLPLAASGNLTPWIAVIGMSSSSLLVVLNALRITYFNTQSELN